MIIFVSTVCLGAVLFRLSQIDWRTGRLPDRLTLPTLAGGLALNTLLQSGWPSSHIWGAIVGYLVFWLIGTVFYAARGVDGLGLGDAKLLAASGAWLGIQKLPFVVLIAAVGALVVALAVRAEHSRRIAFGPYLAAASFFLWLVVLWIETPVFL